MKGRFENGRRVEGVLSVEPRLDPYVGKLGEGSKELRDRGVVPYTGQD